MGASPCPSSTLRCRNRSIAPVKSGVSPGVTAPSSVGRLSSPRSSIGSVARGRGCSTGPCVCAGRSVGAAVPSRSRASASSGVSSVTSTPAGACSSCSLVAMAGAWSDCGAAGPDGNGTEIGVMPAWEAGPLGSLKVTGATPLPDESACPSPAPAAVRVAPARCMTPASGAAATTACPAASPVPSNKDCFGFTLLTATLPKTFPPTSSGASDRNASLNAARILPCSTLRATAPPNRDATARSNSPAAGIIELTATDRTPARIAADTALSSAIFETAAS